MYWCICDPQLGEINKEKFSYDRAVHRRDSNNPQVTDDNHRVKTNNVHMLKNFNVTLMSDMLVE